MSPCRALPEEMEMGSEELLEEPVVVIPGYLLCGLN